MLSSLLDGIAWKNIAGGRCVGHPRYGHDHPGPLFPGGEEGARPRHLCNRAGAWGRRRTGHIGAHGERIPLAVAVLPPGASLADTAYVPQIFGR